MTKVAKGFAKDNADLFILKGGVMGNSVFKASDIDAIAELPTMEEIRAQLAGLVVQPASLIAGLLQSATSQVVNVLQAYLDDQNKDDTSAPAEDAA